MADKTDAARERFEAWAVPRGYDVSGYEEPDTYPDMDTYRVAKAWHAGCEWQAALASAGQQQARVAELEGECERLRGALADIAAKMNEVQNEPTEIFWVDGRKLSNHAGHDRFISTVNFSRILRRYAEDIRAALARQAGG